MTPTELVEILKALNAGAFTREAAIEAMVARGEVREEAAQTIALHLGESAGDVVE